MKTIEERADKYIGHSFDIDEPSSVTAKRFAFIAGAKSEHRELTKWNDPNIKKPTEYKRVEIKYRQYSEHFNYAIAYICRQYEFDFSKITWIIDNTNHIINPNNVIGWREIQE